jgi:PAS domain S-box-containing protein/putative nucleotidyltransferase with HDIG domain
VTWKSAETAETMRAALDAEPWDAVVADHRMPNFDGLAALRVLQEKGLDIPFIIVSGTIGEETAVAAMKAGAHDYLMKGSLARLAPTIDRELRDAAVRREKRRLEEGMREAAREWRTTFDAMKDAVCLIDKDLRIVRCNRPFCNLVGKPWDKILGQTYYSIVHGCAAPIADCPVVRTRESRHHESLLLEMKNRWWVLAADPVLDDAGQLVGQVYVIVDVTEQRAAEAALRESEIRYRTLFQASSDGILIADLETKSFGYANPAVCRLLGYSVTELTTMGVAAIHPKADLPWVMAEFEAQGRGEKTLALDLPCLRKDGTIVYADIVAGAITIDGKACNVGFFRDITERKRLEAAQRQAEENFRRSLDDSPLGARIVTAEGKTIYANKAILDLYGFGSLEELNATPLKDRYSPQSYAEFQNRTKQRSNGTFPSEYEISIVRKNGEIRILQVFRKEVLWNGRNHYQALYLDVTARKTAEERLNKTLQSLSLAMAATIRVLGLTVEARDPYTAGHQQKTTSLAEAIARDMGLSSERVAGLHMAGLVHDIGKISIPAEILSKPTKLTPGEYALVKTHAQKGYEILKDVEFPWPLAEIVYQHHERMDGSGYPRGLKGDEILMEARILCVADTMEAMVSDRPYRPALGPKLALAEVEKGKGILYDADVAETCLKLFRGKRFSFPA